jgi:hypothetical protein
VRFWACLLLISSLWIKDSAFAWQDFDDAGIFRDCILQEGLICFSKDRKVRMAGHVKPK